MNRGLGTSGDSSQLRPIKSSRVFRWNQYVAAGGTLYVRAFPVTEGACSARTLSLGLISNP